MTRVRAAGTVLTVLALVGYAAGIYVPYAGRALTVTAVMVGLTLVGIGGDHE
ncbi:hypothetical protein ACKVMT_09250 [Halobacteriales archaeon Cl-PHB]